jgi:polyisoprenoid-binding protein YceI
VCAAAAAPAQTIDAARSSVTATFTQMGVPVEGRFTKVGGELVYASATPIAARAHVVIDTASFDLDDAGYNRELHKPEWFDVQRFPRATFDSETVKAGAPGQFEVSGKLTIKGRSVTVSGPLTLRDDGGATVIEGRWPIRRLAFGIGAGEWKDTSVLADEVVVRFRLVVPRPK